MTRFIQETCTNHVTGKQFFLPVNLTRQYQVGGEIYVGIFMTPLCLGLGSAPKAKSLLV